MYFNSQIKCVSETNENIFVSLKSSKYTATFNIHKATALPHSLNSFIRFLKQAFAFLLYCIICFVLLLETC
jgi:hypothetical protein